MYWLFLCCAVFGGTIMLVQMVLTLIGLTGDSLHLDVPHDVGGGHDGGGDFHTDMHGDFHGDVHGDVHGGVHDDTSGVHHEGEHNTSAVLFKMLSVRTIVAALAFFGMAGLASRAADQPPLVTLAIAVVAGVAAMYGVFRLMQLLSQAGSEGTVRVGRTVGQEATVYLRVPGRRAGMGKVQIDVQNRTMEYSAVTDGPELPTGAKVTVVNVISQDTLEVKALGEPVAAVSETEERKSYA